MRGCCTSHSLCVVQASLYQLVLVSRPLRRWQIMLQRVGYSHWEPEVFEIYLGSNAKFCTSVDADGKKSTDANVNKMLQMRTIDQSRFKMKKIHTILSRPKWRQV